MKKLRLVGVMLAMLLVTALVVPTVMAQGNSGNARGNSPTITDIVVASSEADQPEFTILRAALETAGLVEFFDGNRQFTVFAPTDQAFLDLLDALNLTPAELLASPDLATILTYHVTTGNRNSNSVLGARQIRMFSGEFAQIDAGAGTIAGSPIIATDIDARNGTIHVVSSVLIPPSLR